MNNSTPEGAGWLLDEYDSERFWNSIDRRGGIRYASDPLATAKGECWVWRGYPDDQYAPFKFLGRQVQAHRVAYRDFGLKLTDDLTLDHLCRIHRCVNPEHLDPVTQEVNVKRGLLGHKKACPSGHQYTPETTKTIVRNGREFRYCRPCLAASKHRTYLRRKAAGKV